MKDLKTNQVFELLVRNQTALTGREILQALGLDRNKAPSLSAILVNLQGSGKVEQCERRTCEVTGRQSILTWKAVHSGAPVPTPATHEQHQTTMGGSRPATRIDLIAARIGKTREELEHAIKAGAIGWKFIDELQGAGFVWDESLASALDGSVFIRF